MGPGVRLDDRRDRHAQVHCRYTFADVHAAQVRIEVARPGSLALAGPHAARLTRSLA
jgi:hypothetical protein